MRKQTKEKRKSCTDYAIAIIFVLAVIAIIFVGRNTGVGKSAEN